MRVLFCNRDHSLWHGGDSNKIERYIEELTKLGVECGYTHETRPDLSSFDIFHIFHLGHEFSYKFHLEAIRLGKPTIISPIYFPGQSNPNGYRMEMCDYSSGMAFLSEGEAEWVGKLFEDGRKHLKEKEHIVPNGISQNFGEPGIAYIHPNRPEGSYVLCVGRIDQRKNQHRLAQACMELDIPLLLIGEPSDGRIVASLQAIANRWEGLWWEAPKEHNKLAEAYRGAKVLACPSTLEMWPNVVAEGGLAGCNLVVSNKSMTFTDLPFVYRCNPSIDSIKAAVQKAWENPKEYHGDYFRQFTWANTALQLKSVYEGVKI